MKISTGFVELDRVVCFEPSNLIVVASRPSMGKTAFALNIAGHVAVKNKIPCAIFSTLDSKEEIARRMLSAHARVKYSDIQNGALTKRDLNKLERAAKTLSEAPIYIDDNPSPDIYDIQNKIWRLKRECGLKIVIIDYLQLIKGYKNELSKIIRTLKKIARELPVTVLLLSQLNRRLEKRDNKCPKLGDLYDLKPLVQGADIIMFVYREELYRPSSTNAGKAELIIGKNGHGRTGAVKLAFNKDLLRFDNYSLK